VMGSLEEDEEVPQEEQRLTLGRREEKWQENGLERGR